jgi:hypothetical protein
MFGTSDANALPPSNEDAEVEAALARMFGTSEDIETNHPPNRRLLGGSNET